MRLGAITGGLTALRAAGLETGTAGAELGALKVSERDAGLSSDRLKELADAIPNGGAAAEDVVATRLAADVVGSSDEIELAVSTMVAAETIEKRRRLSRSRRSSPPKQQK